MLNLFMLESCPYCKKVVDYADEHNIHLHKFDILNSENAQRLVNLGGKEQVPFLQNEHTGEMMYESNDIISYLEKLNQG